MRYVGRPHVAQDHTRHTRSRRKPFVDDGGIVGKALQGEWQPHTQVKQQRHQHEDMGQIIHKGTGGWRHRFMPHPDWTSLGHAPTHDDTTDRTSA